MVTQHNDGEPVTTSLEDTMSDNRIFKFPTARFDAIDLFAGPGGWDVAATRLGMEVVGIEWDQSACDTRRAAGLPTIQGDVRDFGPGTDTFDHIVNFTDGFIASPPCQTFSIAGKGGGREHLPVLVEAMGWMVDHNVTDIDQIRNYLRQHDLDDRSTLVLEPLRWILAAHVAGLPFKWVALEQVPSVLPIWEAMQDVMASLGYVVQTAILNSEQYGVPQTRRRAVLVARYDEQVALPAPTHSRYHSRSPERLDNGVQKWVSMATALGWGLTKRPSPTVCAGGAATGGAEPFGSGARKSLIAASETTDGWAMRSNYSGPPSKGKTTAAQRGRGLRPVDKPAFAVTSKQFDFTGPASARIRPTVAEVATLQTFPADHPWQGTKGKQHEQIGNAVPPVMAGAILAAVTTPEV